MGFGIAHVYHRYWLPIMCCRTHAQAVTKDQRRGGVSSTLGWHHPKLIMLVGSCHGQIGITWICVICVMWLLTLLYYLMLGVPLKQLVVVCLHPPWCCVDLLIAPLFIYILKWIITLLECLFYLISAVIIATLIGWWFQYLSMLAINHTCIYECGHTLYSPNTLFVITLLLWPTKVTVICGGELKCPHWCHSYGCGDRIDWYWYIVPVHN